MVVTKRSKRGRRSSPPPEIKEVTQPVSDRMVRNYPRICPFCLIETYSAMCDCRRMTIINK